MILTLSSCGAGLGLAAKVVTGGGLIPDVANVQAGRTNTQTVGTSENLELSFDNVTDSVIRPVVRPTGITTTAPVERIEQTNYNVDPFWIVAFVIWSILLWQLPDPKSMGAGVRNLFKNPFKRNNLNR